MDSVEEDAFELGIDVLDMSPRAQAAMPKPRKGKKAASPVPSSEMNKSAGVLPDFQSLSSRLHPNRQRRIPPSWGRLQPSQR